MESNEFSSASTLASRLAALSVALAAALGAFGAASPAEIVCEGRDYPWHLQGVATDGTNVFWTFTTVLVKTDRAGRLVDKVEIGRADGHMGDLCCKDGKVYVGMNLERDASGSRRGDEVWQFDVATLKLEKKYPTPEAVWCNNGLEWWGGSWWVVSSAPRHSEYNYLFEYGPDFRFRTCRLVKSGWTNLGVQTILLHNGELLLGCYGSGDDDLMPHPNCTVRIATAAIEANRKARRAGPIPVLGRVKANTSEGFLVLDGKVWEAHGKRYSKNKEMPQRWGARLVPSVPLNDPAVMGQPPAAK